jgi:hypothetical protein
MTRLFNFMLNLATDPHQQALLSADPTVLIDTADLAEADKAALNSRDRAKVTAALLGELETKDLMAVLGAAALTDPGPDPEPDPDPVPDDSD